MKTFKSFIDSQENEPFVPHEPVHFKHGNSNESPDEPFVPNEPVHYKNDSHIEEETLTEAKKVNWLDKNDNEEHYDNIETPKKLSIYLMHHGKEHTPKETQALKDHSINSKPLNRHLVARHKDPTLKPDKSHAMRIQHLDSATSHKLNHPLHVYSGIRWDPREQMKKTDKVHLPAYTSTTHDKKTAKKFASNHILHIHLKKGDKAAPIEHLSHYHGEHETVLPRNTTLKVNKTPTKVVHGKKTYHVWHATVHSQK